ncbi:DUF1993 family protein [Pendulispora albinea]|uniref:DUF1993 domain-containing protein n=1 Tax=Pendulispora albinea TaxID=2741071 RepID=A0ABZ2LVC9_9BACT
MSLYDASVPQFKRMLTNLDRWLELAIAHAEKKPFDPNVLLVARLAPDQYPLTRQVQAACDAAKFGAARAGGKEPPKHPDTETTFEELRGRIRDVITYLDTFTRDDFAGVEDRLLELPFLKGKLITASDYLYQMSLSNFYFHVTHAYAILRHNGVPLGKTDYIGAANLRNPE